MTLLKVCRDKFCKIENQICIFHLNTRAVIIQQQQDQDCKSFQMSRSETDESCCRHISWYVRSLNKSLKVLFPTNSVSNTLYSMGLVCLHAIFCQQKVEQ